MHYIYIWRGQDGWVQRGQARRSTCCLILPTLLTSLWHVSRLCRQACAAGLILVGFCTGHRSYLQFGALAVGRSITKVWFRTDSENQNRENWTEVQSSSVLVLWAWHLVRFLVLKNLGSSRTRFEPVRTELYTQKISDLLVQNWASYSKNMLSMHKIMACTTLKSSVGHVIINTH